MLSDRELTRAMIEASRKATEACLAAGYGRNDPVTRKSAFSAADEVHRRERPADFAAAPPPPVAEPDPRQERMERDVSRETSGDPGDDVPF
ncbi:hypothetical protein [Microbacterium phage MO526]|uniref:Uncharacterized protein n=1 Tax=Microbacterium phage MO526 TaxID=3108092 RepID=A0ABZ0ZX12_9CAUD|nr:hypothetical protein [Microbacterium phage MO526]